MTSEGSRERVDGRPWVLAVVSMLLLTALVVQSMLLVKEASGPLASAMVSVLGAVSFLALLAQLVLTHRSLAPRAISLAVLAVAVGLVAGFALSVSEQAGTSSTMLLLLNAVGLLLSACAAARRSFPRVPMANCADRVPTDETALPVSLVRLHLTRSLLLVIVLMVPAIWLLPPDADDGAAATFTLATLLFCWVFALAFFVLWPMLSEESDRFRLDSQLEAEAGRARRRFARLRSRRLDQ